MLDRMSSLAAAVAAMLCVGAGDAAAWDDAKYPDFKGQWVRSVGAQWDTTKPRGLPQ